MLFCRDGHFDVILPIKFYYDGKYHECSARLGFWNELRGDRLRQGGHGALYERKGSRNLCQTRRHARSQPVSVSQRAVTVNHAPDACDRRTECLHNNKKRSAKDDLSDPVAQQRWRDSRSGGNLDGHPRRHAPLRPRQRVKLNYNSGKSIDGRAQKDIGSEETKDFSILVP